MAIEHITNEGQNDNEFPFSHLPSKDTETGEEKVIGKGWESQVKMLGPDWVIKEVNPFDSNEEERTQEFLDYLRSSDRIHQMIQDQNRLAKIFEEKHFAKTQAIYGKDQNGKEGYMLIQRLIPGKSLDKLIGKEYENTREMVEQNREQFMDIIWAVKKSFIEFGMPIDFHIENLMRNDNTGNIVLMDAGIPTEEYEIIKNPNVTDRTEKIFDSAYKRLEKISRYEKYLQLTQEEIDQLNKKYNINEEDYQKKLNDIEKMRKEKGIEIELKESESDKMLKKIISERNEVSGQELYEYALAALENKTPTKAQKAVLEKIKAQGTVKGNFEYWRKLIYEGKELG